MKTLEHAITTAGSVSKLAVALDVAQNVVSNWRARGLPKSWELALSLKYPMPIKKTKTKV